MPLATRIQEPFKTKATVALTLSLINSRQSKNHRWEIHEGMPVHTRKGARAQQLYKKAAGVAGTQHETGSELTAEQTLLRSHG